MGDGETLAMTDRRDPLCWLWALREESAEGGCTQQWKH